MKEPSVMEQRAKIARETEEEIKNRNKDGFV